MIAPRSTPASAGCRGTPADAARYEPCLAAHRWWQPGDRGAACGCIEGMARSCVSSRVAGIRPPALGALMVNERGRDVRGGETGPVTIFGPDFPFPFDDWISHPAGPGVDPGRTSWRRGRCRRRWHLRAGRCVRADEARPQASGLRGLADGRAVAFAGVRGSRGRGRGTGRDAFPGVVDVPSTITSTCWACRPGRSPTR